MYDYIINNLYTKHNINSENTKYEYTYIHHIYADVYLSLSDNLQNSKVLIKLFLKNIQSETF